MSTAALSAVERIRDSPQPLSHDAFKRNLSRCREVLSDIQRGRQAVQLVREQHTALRTLLARPELAADPAWYQEFQLLNTRTRRRSIRPLRSYAPTAGVVCRAPHNACGCPDDSRGTRAHTLYRCTSVAAYTDLLQRARALAAER